MDRTEQFYIEFHPNITSGSSYYYGIRLSAPMGKGWVFDSVEYSLDKANWITVDTSGDWVSKTIIQLDNPADGSRVWLRAKPSDDSWGTSVTSYRCSISIISSLGQKVNVGGNIMSLIYGGDFTGNEVDFPSGSKYNFKGLLIPDIGSGIIEDASQLILPATTLTNGCYYEMFKLCKSLIAAPTITQATIQSGYPYDYMFRGCSSLESLTIENTNIRNNEYILYGMSPKTIVYKKEGVTTPSNPNKLTVVTLKNTPFNVAKAKKWVINNKEVKQVVDSQGRLIWKRPKPKPSYSTPFYLEDTSGNGNTVSITKNNSNAPTLTIEKSTNGVNWTTMGTTSTTAITAAIPANGKLYLRCNATSWGSGTQDQNNVISTTGYDNINVGGNIMSLLYGSNFSGQERTFPSGSTRTFEKLFYQNSSIDNSEDLLLPATTLVNWCYAYMFQDCNFMNTTPELPAMMLAESCYRGMFEHTGISTTPILPATTLAQWCYYDMFGYCYSLVTVSTLPAHTLAYGCYENMFSHCSNLKNVELPATTLSERCYMSMFSYCRSLETIKLPASTLVTKCYANMFDECTSLKNVECLATDISANNCLSGWMYNVPAGGTFTKKTGVSWPSGISGIPTGWTVIEV